MSYDSCDKSLCPGKRGRPQKVVLSPVILILLTTLIKLFCWTQLMSAFNENFVFQQILVQQGECFDKTHIDKRLPQNDIKTPPSDY